MPLTNQIPIHVKVQRDRWRSVCVSSASLFPVWASKIIGLPARLSLARWRRRTVRLGS